MNLIHANGCVWKVFITSEDVRKEILNLKVPSNDGTKRQLGVVIWYGTDHKKKEMCLCRKRLTLKKLTSIFYENKEEFEIL